MMLMRIIKIGSFILWLLGLIGYFTLPEDWPIAVQRMGKFAMWFDRDALVAILLGASSAGFAWVAFAPAIAKWWGARRKPIKVNFAHGSMHTEQVGLRSYTYWCIALENVAKRTLEDIEVHVLSIAKQPDGHPMPINRNLFAASQPRQKFDLAQGMKREIPVWRYLTNHVGLEDYLRDKEPRRVIEIGPVDNEGSYIAYPADFYKVDIGIYGKDMPPTFASLALALGDPGMASFGRWREGLKWPLHAEVKISGDRVLQSSQDTEEKTQPKTRPG